MTCYLFFSYLFSLRYCLIIFNFHYDFFLSMTKSSFCLFIHRYLLVEVWHVPSNYFSGMCTEWQCLALILPFSLPLSISSLRVPKATTTHCRTAWSSFPLCCRAQRPGLWTTRCFPQSIRWNPKLPTSMAEVGLLETCFLYRVSAVRQTQESID